MRIWKNKKNKKYAQENKNTNQQQTWKNKKNEQT